MQQQTLQARPPPARQRYDSRYTIFNTSVTTTTEISSPFSKQSRGGSTFDGSITVQTPTSAGGGGGRGKSNSVSSLAGTQRGSKRFLQRVQSNIRTRSHSLTLRHNIADVSRHGAQLQIAAEQVAEKFLRSLRQYSAFGPVLASHGVYATTPEQSMMAESGNPSLRSTANGLGMLQQELNATHDERYNQTLQAIEALLSVPTSRLDAATAHAMRVQQDFMSRQPHQQQQQLPSPGTTPPTPQGLPSMTPVPPSLPSFRATGNKASAMDIDNYNNSLTASEAIFSDMAATDVAFAIWLREHPEATHDEKRAELIRRNNDRLLAEKASRARYIRKWKDELEKELYEDRQATAIVEQRRMTELLETVAEQQRSEQLEQQRLLLQAQEAQKVAWDIFSRTEEAAAGSNTNNNIIGGGGGAGNTLQQRESTTSNNSSMRAAEFLPGNVSDVVLSNVVDRKLQAWLEGEWIHHTHEHESAALRIQCAWRCFIAKTRVEHARYERQENLQQILKAEAESMFAWSIAQQVTLGQQGGAAGSSNASNGNIAGDVSAEYSHVSPNGGAGSAEGVDRTLRSINFFLNSMNAKAMHRRIQRRRRENETREVANFAATRIQAVYRGLRARQRVLLIRDPLLLAQKTHEKETKASIDIQSCIRGFLTRRHIRKIKAAATKIQRAFRQHEARLALVSLKNSGRSKEFSDLEQYAAAIIIRCLRHAVAKKYRRYRLNLNVLETIHRVGRGYLGRCLLARARYAQRTDAATRIQSLVRMLLAKIHVRRIRDSSNKDDDMKVHEHASVVIQRNARVFIARKRRYKAKEQAAAATKIQCCYRCRRSRRQLAQRRAELAKRGDDNKRRDAAMAIQSLFRGFHCRKHVISPLREEHARKAAQMVEQDTSVVSSTEGENLKNDPQQARTSSSDGGGVLIASSLEDDAAATITSFMRLAVAKQQTKQRHRQLEAKLRDELSLQAATCIQSAMRGFLARQCIRHLLEQRAASHQTLQRHEGALMLQSFFKMILAKKKVRALRKEREDAQKKPSVRELVQKFEGMEI